VNLLTSIISSLFSSSIYDPPIWEIVAICGDDIVDEGEECEPMLSPEMCTPTCKWKICGNSRIDVGEECDGGMFCNVDCTLNFSLIVMALAFLFLLLISVFIVIIGLIIVVFGVGMVFHSTSQTLRHTLGIEEEGGERGEARRSQRRHLLYDLGDDV